MELSFIRHIDVAEVSSQVVAYLQGARSPTEKVVDAAIVSSSRIAIENGLAAEFSAELEGALEMHTLLKGERVGQGSDPDEWESELDDAVAALWNGTIGTYMGPGFVGEHSVDTRIHEPGELETFARKVAAGVASRVEADPDMAARIIDLFDKAALLREGKQKPKDDGAKAVVLIVLADYLGRNPEDGVLDLLDLAADDEPILAAAPLEALAKNYVNKEEIRRCMRVLKALSPTWREDIIEATRRSLAPPNAPAETPAKAEKPKRERKKKEKPVPTKSEQDDYEDVMRELAGEVPVTVGVLIQEDQEACETRGNDGVLAALRGIKDHGRITETDLAEKLGLSRSTINNMVREKIACDLGPEQRKSLAEAIDEHLKGLAAARAALGAV